MTSASRRAAPQSSPICTSSPGDATPAEERFAFGYGVFLQLLDDLQDVTIDLAAEHHTLFTLAARRGTLDDLTARLLDFIDIVLDQTRVDAGVQAGGLPGSDPAELPFHARRRHRGTADDVQPAVSTFRRTSVATQFPRDAPSAPACSAPLSGHLATAASTAGILLTSRTDARTLVGKVRPMQTWLRLKPDTTRNWGSS